MGSHLVFDPTRVVLEFLSIQAERIGSRKLEIEFLHTSDKLRIARLKVDLAAQKAFYGVDQSDTLTEFSPQMLNNMGGVRVV
ncbi:hypothetical protein FACS1894103_5120 [Campylobacterota bacterium]|nr:hypothetical protein FACS1894103_5120 [Campylobacterota bacterium]